MLDIWPCGHERWGHDPSKKHRRSGWVFERCWLREVLGCTVRGQYVEICARSPTEKKGGGEVGSDKFDSVVANSQTDVKSSFPAGKEVSCPIVLVCGAQHTAYGVQRITHAIRSKNAAHIASYHDHSYHVGIDEELWIFIASWCCC